MAFIEGWPHLDLRGGLYERFHCTCVETLVFFNGITESHSSLFIKRLPKGH